MRQRPKSQERSPQEDNKRLAYNKRVITSRTICEAALRNWVATLQVRSLDTHAQ
jgi:hypothetical protein